MFTKIYNKLVRDNIPNIIKENGNECETRILKNDEYKEELDRKLNEEFLEYKEEGAVEELADMLEVIYAIGKLKGFSEEELNKIREEKAERRGRFDNKIFLVSASTKD